MRLLEDLQREHELIDRVLSALRVYATRFARGQADASDGGAFIEFFEIYVGRWHHEREEAVLFRALENDAQLPTDRGPMAVLLADHDDGAQSLAALRASLHAPAEFERIAFAYSAALWTHIDAENSVLFPESEQQLRRNQIHELPSPEITGAVREAAERAEVLVARYGTSEPIDLIRGDGCVMCPAYGASCRGVEHEWWNEWQWEELDAHVAST